MEKVMKIRRTWIILPRKEPLQSCFLLRTTLEHQHDALHPNAGRYPSALKLFACHRVCIAGERRPLRVVDRCQYATRHRGLGRGLQLGSCLSCCRKPCGKAKTPAGNHKCQYFGFHASIPFCVLGRRQLYAVAKSGEMANLAAAIMQPPPLSNKEFS